jgi:hypothetical protein
VQPQHSMILMGVLGEDYLITINTEAYNQAMANQEVYQCNHCTMDYTWIVNKGEENENEKTKQVPAEIPTNHCRYTNSDFTVYRKCTNW